MLTSVQNQETKINVTLLVDFELNINESGKMEKLDLLLVFLWFVESLRTISMAAIFV